MARDIRQRALQKIASLSAASSSLTYDRSDFDRLCKACHGGLRGREYANGYQASARPPMVRHLYAPSIVLFLHKLQLV